MPKYKTMSSLKTALRKATFDTVLNATSKIHEKLQENVGTFYSVPEGIYHRTGQLRDSVMNDGVTPTINGAIGQVSINTSTQYAPSGRDTETIYGYAEDDELIGHGGFWSDTGLVAQEMLNAEVIKKFG